MTDQIDNDLTPSDGLCNAHVRLAGLDKIGDTGAATIRFDLSGDDGAYLATMAFAVPPMGTIEAMIAEAHVQLKGVLRQWLYRADASHRGYEKRLASPHQEPTPE